MLLVYAVMQRAISRVRNNMNFRLDEIKQRLEEEERLRKAAQLAAQQQADGGSVQDEKEETLEENEIEQNAQSKDPQTIDIMKSDVEKQSMDSEHDSTPKIDPQMINQSNLNLQISKMDTIKTED